MNDQWNGELLREFIQLRDALRAAKREKNYQHILSLGRSILELDKRAGVLKIAAHIFLKDMADACIKLGDTTAAADYLVTALNRLREQQTNPTEWQKDIDAIQKRLEKLQTSCPTHRSTETLG